MSSPVDATLIPPDERPKASTVEPTLFPPASPASPGPPALPQTLVPPAAKPEPVAPTLCPPEEVPAHPTVPAPASLPGSTSRPSGTRPVVPAISSSALAHATPTVKVTPSQVSTNPGTMSGVVRKLNNQGTIAGYEILGELGRGGMGVVYRARQVRLNRLVALKMILAGGHASSRAVARFKAEAESIARLQHPNVVQVYEIGEHDGHPFFSLEFVDGGALDGKLAGTPQPPRQAAILVEKLARAMHEAHSRGVIHRDLKPQNVLLTRDGEPKITDFGLAKTLDSDSGSTREGEVMGTPSYMAPEQAAGKIKDMGPATDVYALGAILYETLTGRPPFKAATPYDTLLQVLHEEPVPVRQLQARTPRDLETICHKCLQKDIPRRYGSAVELAEDLRRFLAGEPIQARPSSVWERSLKWARRHPTAASLLGVACLAAVGLFAGILWYHQHLQQVVAAARADEQSARMAEQQAREAQQLAQTRLEGQSRIQAGKAALDARDWQAAQLSLTQALAVLGQQAGVRDLRDQASRLLTVVKSRLAEQDAAARAAERRQEFTRLRDDALFYASAFTGLDQEANRQATIQAASRALALYGFGPQARTSPTGEDRPDAEILEGCQELTLVLAEAAAQAPAGLSSSEKTARVREALRLMEPVRKMGTLSHAFHRRRARYLLLLGEHEESGRETAAALQRKPTSPLDHFLNGDDSLRQGRLTQADQDFEAALRLRPDHFWARYFLAVCQLRQQRHGEAAANLTGCLACRDLVWIFLLRGFADGERGRFDAAEADYQRALERKPDDLARYALFVNRGVMRLRQGRTDDALADLRQAVTLRPNDFQAYANLADALAKAGKPDLALVQLDQAVKLKPDLAALYRARAKLHRENGRPEQALQDLALAATREKVSGGTPAGDHVERAKIYLSQKQYEQALAECDVALQLRPDHVAAQRWRGEALLGLRRYAEAVEALDRHIRRGKPGWEVYRARGLARAKLGRHAEAVEDLTRALQLKSDPELYSARGWVHLACNAPRLARHDFDRACRLAPKNADALAGRGFAAAQEGDVYHALSDAREAVRLGPATPRLLYNVARVHAQVLAVYEKDNAEPRRRAEQLETALTLLEQALKAQPASQRGAFWRSYVATDAAMQPLRNSPAFTRLHQAYSVAAR